MKFSLVFMGTAPIGIGVLELLQAHPLIDLQLIIAPLSKKVGRDMVLTDPATVVFAKEKNIPFYQSENINKDEELWKKLQLLAPDVLLVFAFSQFLSQRYLDLAKFKAYNIHTSILPKYRGASPIQQAILHGDRETGVSIQKMVKKMDAGDIVVQQTIPIYPYETTPLLYERLKNLSANLMVEFIQKVLVENNLETFPQREEDVSFAPMIKKEDGEIDFSRDSGKKILSMIAAYDPWPGVYFHLEGEKISLIKACRVDEIPSPGGKKRSLYVHCGDGQILHLQIVKRAGKKEQTDSEFLNGFRGDFKNGPYILT